jgi:hypothetical protein
MDVTMCCTSYLLCLVGAEGRGPWWIPQQAGRVRGEGCSRSWGCSVLTLLRGHRTLWGRMECSAENRQAQDGRRVSASLGEGKAVWMKASWPYRSYQSACSKPVLPACQEKSSRAFPAQNAGNNGRWEYSFRILVGQSLAGSWPPRAGSMKSMDPTLRRL